MVIRYRVYYDGWEGDCPHDPDFSHEFYYGCIPKDFKPHTGRSRKHRQRKVETPEGVRYKWDGGCDARSHPPLTQQPTHEQEQTNG